MRNMEEEKCWCKFYESCPTCFPTATDTMKETTTYKHPKTGQAIYYAPSVEHEDDVSKIWHDFRDCETSTYANLHMDWSPYSDPSKNDIKMWFALGCPDRRTIGDGETVGSLTTERLVEALGKNLCIEGY